MKRADLIIRCMAAYARFSPPPEDATSIDMGLCSKPQIGRWINLSKYIDEQLTRAEHHSSPLSSSKDGA